MCVCMYMRMYVSVCILQSNSGRQCVVTPPSTADRAKSIKTRATVNESATDKLIRELREENARLMEMLKKMDLGLGPQMSQEQGVSEEGEPYALAAVQMYVRMAFLHVTRRSCLLFLVRRNCSDEEGNGGGVGNQCKLVQVWYASRCDGCVWRVCA